MTCNFQFADLKFTPEIRGLRGPEKTEILRPKVSALLELLLKAHPGVVSKAECLDHLWPDTHVEQRSLAQVVVELRKALVLVGGSRKWVENIPKGGYRFTEQPLIEDVYREPSPVPEATSQRLGLKRLPRWVLLLALGLLVLAIFIPLRNRNRIQLAEIPSGQIRLAILPIAKSTHSGTAWLRYSYPELLSDALANSGLVEVIDFKDVYKISQNLDSEALAQQPWENTPIMNMLGVNTLIWVEVNPHQALLDFSVTVVASEKTNSFSFQSSDPQATIATVTNRILDGLGLEDPSERVFESPYLNETYANGYDFYLKGQFNQAKPYFEVCFEQNPTFGRHTYHLAYSLLNLRDYEALEVLLADPNCPGSAEWLYLRAEWHFAKRDFKQSELQLHQILKDNLGSRDIIASSHFLLGIILTRTDRSDMGQTYFEKSIQLFKEIGHLQGQANALNAQLRARQYLELPVDNQRWRELLAIGKLLRNRVIEAKAHYGMGDNHYNAAEWEQAYEAYEHSLAIRRELSDPMGIGICLSGMGTSSIKLKEFVRAERLLHESLAINIELGDTYNQVNQNLNLGNLFLAQLKLDEAKTVFEEAKNLSELEKDTEGVAIALLGLAEIGLHHRDYERVRSLLDTGLALGSTRGVMRAEYLCYSAALAYQEKNADKALALIKQAKSILGDAAWREKPQQYLSIYQTTVTTGEYQLLPYERDPMLGPDP